MILKKEKDFKLRRMTMKKFSFLLSVIFILTCCQPFNVYGSICGNNDGSSTVASTNEVTSINTQNMQGQGYATAEGGDASAYAVSGDASSGSISNISTNSVSNYKGRTSPISTVLPYLPSWTHGGWGILQTYFPNGPSSNMAYEQVVYPKNSQDIKMLKAVLKSIPHDGPLDFLGGVINDVAAVFGAPDNFHHGRGFEIASSIERKRRPEGKPLLIFIDSNIDRNVLRGLGFAYVGRVSLEGKSERNWDQVYKAAIAETLPWDVDMIIVSGGMKGVTVGSNFSFPTAAGAYSQLNYSLSMFGGASSGVTEGKGVAMISAECYRYHPRAIQRRAIPQSFYDKIHASTTAAKQTKATEKQAPKTESAALTNPQRTQAVAKNSQTAPPVVPKNNTKQRAGIEISRELYELAGFNQQQQLDYTVIK